MKLKIVKLATCIVAMNAVVWVQEAEALFGMGDIVHDPMHTAESAIQTGVLAEELAWLAMQVQQVTQFVTLATETKRILSDPETALYYAGYLIGNTDVLDEFLGEGAVADIRELVWSAENLNRELNHLEYNVDRFDNVQGYELRGDFLEKYAQISAMHNRMKRRFATAEGMNGKLEEWRIDRMDRLRRLLNGPIPEHSREKIRAQLESVQAEDQMIANQRTRDYQDFHAQTLMLDVEDRVEDAAVEDAYSQALGEFEREQQVIREDVNAALSQFRSARTRFWHGN